jgi:NAD-dependent DNA ligase
MSKSLKEFLIECKDAYYAGDPIISDAQYDHLEDICNEDLSVGTHRGKTRHWFRMYSLQKVYVGEKLPFDKVDLVTTPKLDGAAIAVRYLDSKLHSVVTRGDGEYGDDVSHLFQDERIFEPLGIQKTVPLKGAYQITGELVAPDYIDNARNYAAGALGLKNQVVFGDKILKFFAYNIQPYTSEWYTQDMINLTKIGFETVWREREEGVESYPTDGQVIRVQRNSRYEEMGYTSKHPRGAYALKVRTEGIKTKILDVIWQTGKSGKVTPVALLDPIEIDGATVSRATLNNFGFIEALDVKIGDSVMVERAGGIIPRIIRKAE